MNLMKKKASYFLPVSALCRFNEMESTLNVNQGVRTNCGSSTQVRSLLLLVSQAVQTQGVNTFDTRGDCNRTRRADSRERPAFYRVLILTSSLRLCWVSNIYSRGCEKLPVNCCPGTLGKCYERKLSMLLSRE